jgi:hypothetical protein
MKTLILAAGLLAATSGCGWAGEPLADVTVYDRSARRTLPLHSGEGNRWVVGTPGNEYSLRIRNRSGSDLLAVISVDGVNAITGQSASPDQSGYVIPAFGSIEIKGWRKSLERVAAFYFTDLGDSYAARTGRPDDVGVIGVALFKRKSAPELELSERRRERDAWGARSAQESAAAPRYEQGDQRGAQPAEPQRTQPGAPEPHAEKRAADNAPAAAAAQALGTGHGRSQSSHARYVEFERESAAPNEIVTLRYDSRENLVRMGILRDPRRRPDPFPAAFVPDPR